MGGGEGGRVTVRFPILGPLGISFGAPDGAQRPVISAISPTGLAAEVPGLRPGLVLVSVQGEPTDRGFDHAIAAIKESPRPLELVFAPPDDADDASFRSAGSGGRTELMASALEGREATAAALRSQPEVDAQDDEGWTALHHACGAGQLGSIEELLRAGCAIDIEDSIGETAADVAEGAGRSDVVSLLQKCDVASAAAAAAGAPADGAGHKQQELRHAKEQVAELTQALATERRCLQTLRDQAQVGRDGALASLLEELELAKTQLHTARQQQREAEDALQDERASGSSKAERDELRQRLCASSPLKTLVGCGSESRRCVAGCRWSSICRAWRKGWRTLPSARRPPNGSWQWRRKRRRRPRQSRASWRPSAESRQQSCSGCGERCRRRKKRHHRPRSTPPRKLRKRAWPAGKPRFGSKPKRSIRNRGSCAS